jgi:hypothetical protein
MSSDNDTSKKSKNIFEEDSIFTTPIFEKPIISKEDPYLEIMKLIKKFEKPYEYIVETCLPKVKIQYPKKWSIRPNENHFIFINEAIVYKDDICTFIITKKRNPIEMIYDPNYENNKSIAPRLAYIGYYKEDLVDCEIERYVLFLHPNQKYIIIKSVQPNPTEKIKKENNNDEEDDDDDEHEEEDEKEEEEEKEKPSGLFSYFYGNKK